MRLLNRAAHVGGRAYLRRLLRGEHEAQAFHRHNERTAEYGFALKAIGHLAPRTVLDVGTGTTAWPALVRDLGCVVTAIDNVRDYWPEGMVNRHWQVLDHDIQAGPAPGVPFDLVTCISVLEHVRDHATALRHMLGSLRPGGHLVLCGPYTDREYVEDCYRAPGADPAAASMPYICRSYSRSERDGWLSLGAEIVRERYSRGWTGRHWCQGQRIAPMEPSSLEGPHNHACFLLRRT